MTDRAHGNPVIDLEEFLPAPAEGQKQNPVAIADCRDGTSRGELRLNVLAAIRNRFDPTIWLFDHATLRLKSAAIRFSGKVVMPSRDTILITGKIFAFRSTPPVAVSDSAAASSARKATVTASSSPSFANCFFP